jgi:hypothetical protein
MTADFKMTKEDNEKLQHFVIDLKARSTRDNLVCYGIREEEREDIEAVLREFLQRKFKLVYEISFECVHRIGKWNELSEYSRNIITKFTYFKDRVSAPKKLRGTRICVNEQFPPEIEEQKKKSYPVIRQAKKDHKRTKLVRDVLYIYKR